MAEDSGMWVKVYPEYAGGGGAEGSPPAPVLTDEDGNPDTSGGSVIFFASGGEGDAGPTLAYGAEISPNDNGETVTVESDNPTVGGEVVVSGTIPFTDYVVKVFGVNVAGRGNASTTAAFQLNYNEATGGTFAIVDNYNGTGEKWKVHTLLNGDTNFNVKTSINDFRVLVQAGGGGGQSVGGSTNSNCNGNGGNGVDETVTLDVGNYPASVAQGSGGNGNGGGRCVNGGGQPGYPTTFHIWNMTGGAGGGCPGAGGSTRGPRSDITGEELQYGGYNSTVYGAGHPGACCAYGAGGGRAGCVIIAYQIGISTTREIQQAQAEAAAREAGYENGYSVGVNDGREEVQDELRAMAASTLEVSE